MGRHLVSLCFGNPVWPLVDWLMVLGVNPMLYQLSPANVFVAGGEDILVFTQQVL